MLSAAAVVTVLLAWFLGLEQPPVTRSEAAGLPETAVEPIDMDALVAFYNEAQPDELMTVKGIGPKLAEAIVLERSTRGPFFYPEDLTAVKGIGSKMLVNLFPEAVD